MIRNICKICKERPVAINYHKDNKVFYRSKCDHCSKRTIIKKSKWEIAGYKMKLSCDRCGFSSKHKEQFNVFYVDGNPSNCRFTNLKTVCANCQRILHIFKIQWKQGDLVPDF